MIEFTTEIRVAYPDTDAMGVVYHANYIKYFETGRTELLRDLGYPYSRLEMEGIMFPVVECGCKYRNPARYDDVLLIKAKVKDVKGASFSMEYEVRKKETGELLTTGMTKHAVTDTSLKPVRLKEKNPGLHKKMKG